MSYSLSISIEAELDMMESVLWYNSQLEDLGAEFVDQLDAAFNLIVATPLSFPVKYKNMRVMVLPRFPFIIAYEISGNLIKIMAVFHTSKNPDKLESL